MTKFCPVCGGIMLVETKNRKKKILKCPICGHEEEIKEKKEEKPVDLVPAEIREEEKVKAGVVKDKKIEKVVLDEDTIREALEMLQEREE